MFFGRKEVGLNPQQQQQQQKNTFSGGSSFNLFYLKLDYFY